MKVDITVVNQTRNCIIFEEIQEWDNEACETASGVYKAAIKEYGRCVSKMYIDGEGGKAKHIGWVFQKRMKYEDCNEMYLQETWIVPLKKYELKTIREYAL